MKLWHSLFLFFPLGLFAQLSPLYTNLSQLKSAYHPAYAGMEYSFSMTGTFRSQWSGIPGAPSQKLLAVHFPLYLAGGGIGIVMESNTTGLRTFNKFSGQYSFHKALGRSVLGLGGSISLLNLRFDGNRFRTPTGSYNDGIFIDHNDAVLTTGFEQSNSISFEAGIYYQSADFEAGITLANFNQPTFQFTDFASPINSVLTISSQYSKEINNDITSISSALLISDLISIQSIFLTGFVLKENFQISGGFRGYNKNSMDGFIAQTGLKISENWKMLYSFELGLSGIGRASGGSHEIGINYNLNKSFGRGIPPRIIYSPRFL
jgi:type IX secretion system PorP/SprF family membrane protein